MGTPLPGAVDSGDGTHRNGDDHRERRRHPAAMTDGGRDRERGAGAHDVSEADDGTPIEDQVYSEDLLVSAGVLEEAAEGTDLALVTEFERAWNERIRQIRRGNRALRWLGATHGVDADDLEVVAEDGRFAVVLDGSPVEEWPSEATFLAGIVAEPTLKEWLPQSTWERLTGDLRRELVAQLLLFLEQCPACDGDLEFDEEPGGESVHVSLHCPDCGTTILEGAY